MQSTLSKLTLFTINLLSKLQGVDIKSSKSDNEILQLAAPITRCKNVRVYEQKIACVSLR